jgi:hypothetical protein
MVVDRDVLDGLFALAFGLAFAGFVAASFELFTADRASFRLLQRGWLFGLATLPVVIGSAPYIILRNTLRGRRIERRPLGFVFAATLVALVWGLMTGRLVMDLVGHLLG